MAAVPEAATAKQPLPTGLVHVWVSKGKSGYGIYFKQVRAILRGVVDKRLSVDPPPA